MDQQTNDMIKNEIIDWSGIMTAGKAVHNPFCSDDDYNTTDDADNIHF